MIVDGLIWIRIMPTRIADDFESIRAELDRLGSTTVVRDQQKFAKWRVKDDGERLPLTNLRLRHMTLVEDGTGRKFRYDGVRNLVEIEE